MSLINYLQSLRVLLHPFICVYGLNRLTSAYCPQLSSEDVVSSYIERIKEIQPILNCVVEECFEEALKEARKCDQLLKSQDAPSVDVLAKEKPLFGVPFTTKVIF